MLVPGPSGKVMNLDADILVAMFGSLSSMVIMLFPLIYRMLIYIFLLLSIIVFSCVLFDIMFLISGRSCLLGWPQPLGTLCP